MSRTASVITSDGKNFDVPVECALMMGKLKKQLDIRKSAFLQLKEGTQMVFEKVLEWCKYCQSPNSGMDKKRHISGRDGFLVAQSDFGDNYFMDIDFPKLMELINLAEELMIPSLEYGGSLIMHRMIDSNTPMETLRQIVNDTDEEPRKAKLLEELQQTAKEHFGEWSDDECGNPEMRQNFLSAIDESFKCFDYSNAGFSKEEFEQFVQRKADEIGRW
uniref:Skp1_POZ domain-containing protein n=1 Tax=Steinernema glaseri TaxID=37863 RepID=A0A1I7YG95_9BILA